MRELENNALFWQKLDTLVLSSILKIDRPKGTSHFKYHNLIYPVDYGYLSDTLGTDAQPIDVYRGTMNSNFVGAIVISADILKKDCVAKLLIGCTEQEKEDIMSFLNQTEFQKAILIQRGNEVPSWATSD